MGAITITISRGLWAGGLGWTLWALFLLRREGAPFWAWPEPRMEGEAAFPPTTPSHFAETLFGVAAAEATGPPEINPFTRGLPCFLLGSLPSLAPQHRDSKLVWGRKGPDSPSGFRSLCGPLWKNQADVFTLTIITDGLWCFQPCDSVTLRC